MSELPPGLDRATVDKLLTTTRAVRRRLDLTRPVPVDVVRECLELAIQAPTGSNQQWWRWIVVSDPGVRGRLAELYRSGASPSGVSPTDVDSYVPTAGQQQRLASSAQYLTEHLHEVPILVVPCTKDRGGAAGWPPSIYPAVWSFLLALRSRGLGSVMTTVHLFHKEEAAELLGVPSGFVQACLLPVAYYTGLDFQPAARRPVDEVAFLDRWGEPLPR